MSNEEDTLPTGVIEADAWSMPIPKFRPEDNPHGMVEESSFATLFPKVKFTFVELFWIMFNDSLAFSIVRNTSENVGLWYKKL